MNDTDRNSYRILLTAVKIRLNVTNNFIYYFVRNMELLYLCSEIFDLMKKGRYISKAGRLLIQIAQEIFFS